ncbi:murein biosynthesis integral membrane protein MurJ [Saccharophagus sp. K07]|uniref:murein biosynthesis integral membrane protein MurJ n=1 Tax=Saccharophagus sp. K07 TaxID=2283636 RepID=UPI00210724C5|nr:murein biosynthesis integral membrane protein MurJ [Saccharophagus sp. K07]
MSAPSNPPVKKSGLLRSSALVGIATMLSRVLGLVRDVVFAWFIGASGGADAFFVAFKVPNFLRRLFSEGAFAQAFVPVLSEYRQKGSIEAVRHLIDRIAGCLGMAVISVSALAVLGAPLLTFVFAPGFYMNAPEKFALTADMVRITFPYLALISLAGFAGSILNSYDRFAVPALTPVTLNIVLITAAVWISPMLETPVMALAWGVLVAGVCQLVIQLPFLARLHLLPRPKVAWSDPAVKKVLTLMAPAMFGVSVSQINLLLDTVLASLISDGSVSWLYYSDRLIELPLGVFGIAIATVILPALSRQYSAACEHYSHTLDWALRTVLLIGFPATVALVVMAEPIIITLFQHGERFSAFDARMSSYSLMAYAVGLSAFMLIKVLATGYFSRQDTKTPVKIGIKAMVANMVFNMILVMPFHFLVEAGHVGLALATSGSAFLNAGWLYTGLRRSGAFAPRDGWVRFLTLLAVASGSMGAFLAAAIYVLPDFVSLEWWLRLIHIGWLCVGGMLIYGAVLFMGGWRLKHLRPDFVVN